MRKIKKLMTLAEVEFRKEFSLNFRALIRELNETIVGIADESYISRRTVQRYLNADTLPTLASINNMIKGIGLDYEDLITFPSSEPVDWTPGEKLSKSITEDDQIRIGMLRKRVRFGVGGTPTNMYVANASEWIDGEFVISRRDYQQALSDGLNRLITGPDGEGGRVFIETIDIMSKAFLIPKRDLYRYLDGTRTMSVLHAYNIINFYGIRPQCLLGNFSMFVVEDCDD